MPSKPTTNNALGRSAQNDMNHSELRYDNAHQVGGIITGSLDSPAMGRGMGSPARPSRVAFFNTGSGLRFTVTLDRGSDILDAFYNQHSLAYLSPVGLNPPSTAANTMPAAWLDNFPGGLLATCGPQYIGRPRVEDDRQTTLHGHHSNTPATIQSLINPDPHRNQNQMSLTTLTRDVSFLGQCIEVKRTIRCTLGLPEIHIEDEVTNLANQTTPHHWLYHINLGWPLLDDGAKFIYRGKATYWQNAPEPGKYDQTKRSDKELAQLKRVSKPLATHAGAGERGLVVELEADHDGVAHVGLINPALKLGLALEFPVAQIPRLANWQHYGERGSYVSGLEPFRGSLMGKDRDDYADAAQYLEPGQSRAYRVTMRVITGSDALKNFAKHDGKVTAR